MRIVQITHAESADVAVMANVANFLLGIGSGHSILHADRPDVGAEVVPPLAQPTQAMLAFGGSVPSIADAAVPQIAPGILIPPVPAASLPAPPPALPGVAPAVPAVPGSPVPTDHSGLPWDARIHASSKTQNKSDGLWRQKRETDPLLVSRVETELRKAMGIAAPPKVPPVPPPPLAAASIFAQGIAAAPPADAAPANFGELMLWATPLMLAGRLPNASLMGSVTAEGLSSLNDLIVRPDLVAPVHARMLAALVPA